MKPKAPILSFSELVQWTHNVHSWKIQIICYCCIAFLSTAMWDNCKRNFQLHISTPRVMPNQIKFKIHLLPHIEQIKRTNPIHPLHMSILQQYKNPKLTLNTIAPFNTITSYLYPFSAIDLSVTFCILLCGTVV